MTDLRINGKPARFEASAARLAKWSMVIVPTDLDATGAQPIDIALSL